ncbi:MAG: hypothetical protein JXR89_04975 [Deltaproteobacteria bacterium]|nr:hypothetical protein [Deltaproteobacteria bacterium]
MDRETQIDTYDIDKLLADDDFIDDFDFAADTEAQFVGGDDSSPAAEEIPEKAAAPATKAGGEAEAGFETEDKLQSSTRPAGAGVLGSVDVMAEIADDFDAVELEGLTVLSEGRSAWLKGCIAILVLIWLAQFFVVLSLLGKPAVIRDTIRPLAALSEFSPPVSSPAESPEPEAGAPAAVADGPEVLSFNLYLPMYSLDGLKVFNAEVEITRFADENLFSGTTAAELQGFLRLLLQGKIGRRMWEQIPQAQNFLEEEIKLGCEAFLVRQGVDPERVRIRIHNPHVQ